MRWYNTLIHGFLIIVLCISTGCGGPKSENQPQAQPEKKPVMQKGGQVSYGSLQEPDTLNPLFSDLLASAELGSLIFSGLVTRNDKGEWIPDLAVEVPTAGNGGISPDGLTITYRLRQNVQWHDGAPFTAEDVRFTWQTIMNRRLNIISREGYEKISRMDTPDPYTVVVKFSEHYTSYLSLFNTILPKHLLGSGADLNKAAFNRAPVGTGPFKYKEWRIAESIILEANPGYFRGRPNLDGIVYKVIPDASVLLNQLKTGDVDIVSNIAFAQLEQVKAISGVKVIVTPNLLWEHIDFNLDDPIFQDVKVRKAIVTAIDRQIIVNSIMKNVATPAAADQPPVSWAYNPTLKVPGRDLNAARTLLTEAGWKQGADGVFAKDGRKLSFTLTTTAGNKIRGLVAQNIAQQLKELGIAVEVKPAEVPGFFDEILKLRRFQVAMYAWVSGSDPDNYNMWNSKKIPGRGNAYEGQNYPGWRNPEVDKLTEQGIKATDMETRKQIFLRIQDIIIDDCPVIPLYFYGNIDAARNRVLNFAPNPTQAGNLWNAWQWGLAAK